MSDSPTSLIVAEPKATYQSGGDHQNCWVETLVDCPGLEGLLTYRIPADLSIKPGDILTVPLNNRQVGAIAIRLLASPPADVPLAKIREVEDVIGTGFFENSYWQVLERVAQYYCTPLISVVRGALPPGLLMRSQRRVRLHREAIPDGADTFVGRTARQILALLDAQPDGDYSVAYLQRQVKGARRGVKDLLKRGWVESYLKPPQPSRPKLKKAVTLVADGFEPDVTERQREVLDVLRRRGGDMWLNELLQVCHATSSIVNKLAEKGYVVVEYREILRTLDQPNVADDRPKILTDTQTYALKTIQSLDEYNQVLLHGVTGSGKTEVYLQAIAPLLRAGQSALVLVPEIGLTPQLTDRFRARFGKKVNVYHSGLSHGERYDTWRQVLSGEPQVVIGTRSAVFVPLPKLGLIILDEEHDSSFKQDSLSPTYHARTVAQWRAELENCPLVLGSATPSLETWVAVNGQQANLNTDAPCKTYYLSLPERIQSRPLPPVEIVDMRQELKQGNRSIFSRSLQDELQQLKQKQRQGILFIPRRGHSTFVSCRSCGYVIECPDCDVSLSYHYAHEGANQLLRCHYCNYTTAHPNNCPECGSPYLKFFGSGTQRVSQELAKAFPDLRVIRFDSDTTRTKGAHRTLLTQFANGEADLLIGTQMLTKGLDLAGVTLVGVVAADGLLHLSDYRAAERAFQTLTQVAGRAGRGDEPGQVIVQTYSPQHPVIQAVKTHGYEVFTEAELVQRESLNYPPYGHLILLRLSGLEEINVEKAAETLADWLSQAGSGYEILGPAPAGIMRIARRYRWQILLKFPPDVAVELPDVAALQRICPPDVSLTIDVDPLNMM
ncbi:primosomal protein N' [Coleofasciculus sp. E1-EBD-02]|uniref:primosomal protein N' n=1 Tax=Coleofasciculus sp. E1-EBD-02 TaxID=3068481 RepID=UPI0032F5947B